MVVWFCGVVCVLCYNSPVVLRCSMWWCGVAVFLQCGGVAVWCYGVILLWWCGFVMLYVGGVVVVW